MLSLPWEHAPHHTDDYYSFSLNDFVLVPSKKDFLKKGCPGPATLGLLRGAGIMPCNVFTETKTLTVHGKRSSSSEMLSAFSSQKCLLSQKEWQAPQVCILPASIPEQGPPAWFYCSLVMNAVVSMTTSLQHPCFKKSWVLGVFCFVPHARHMHLGPTSPSSAFLEGKNKENGKIERVGTS